MEPQISNLVDDQYLRFRIEGVNVSIANSLRRIIISDIPCIVFRSTPHDQSRVNFEANTTRMNNELLKQRISCIPIHITDTAFPHEDYIAEINMTNDGDKVIYATTGDFKLKNTKTDTYSDAVGAMFPPNPLTGDHIDIARLRPGEQLKFTAGFDIGKAKEDGAFNVACTCSYAFAQDPEAAMQGWLDKSQSIDGTKEEVEATKRDWMLLEAKRYTLPDTYDFVVETVGQFGNRELIYKACHVMLGKLKRFEETLQTKGDVVNKSNSTIPHCFDITLDGEDHTLGKVIEFVIYAKHYAGDKTVSFCGFRKPHPHIDSSVFRIAFTTPKETFDVSTVLVGAIQDVMPVYESIGAVFREKNST